jgi:hypothetical protein
MNLSEFLRPTKSRIILALVIPYIYSGIVILGGHIVAYATNSQVSLLVLSAQYLFLIAGALFESLVTYPFACGLITLFSKARRRKLGDLRRDRKGILLVSLSILVFNPLSLRLILLAIILIAFPIQEFGLPCGVLVAGVYGGSPAGLAGLRENEIILSFDSDNTRDPYRLLELLSGHEPGDIVKVLTDRGEYELELGVNPDTGGPYMGINLTGSYCDCGNGICEAGEQVRINNTTFTYCGRDCG